MQSRGFQLSRPPHARPHAFNVQGCLTYKKTPSPRTLQQSSAWGHMGVSWGGHFLMSEGTLYISKSPPPLPLFRV
jgi:hypothetical protein